MEKRMEKTDYKITEFHNSEFGSIRMIEDGGRLLFSGIDVAFALGYYLSLSGAKSQGIKQLMAGAGIMLLGTTLIPQLATLFS